MAKRGGGAAAASGGGGGAKRAKKQYIPTAEPSKGELQTGFRGVLFAHDPFKEKEARAEMRHLLSKYAPQESAPAQEGGAAAGGVAAALAAELAEASAAAAGGNDGHFVDTGCRGQAFLRLSGRCPVEVVHRIAEGLRRGGQSETRFISKMQPVLVCSKPELGRLCSDFAPVVTEWCERRRRNPPAEPYTFAVVVDHKNSPGGDNYGGCGGTRDVLIQRLAALMPKQPEARVDVGNPDVAVFCTIIKAVACCGLAERYSELGRFNIRRLCSQDKPQQRQQQQQGEGAVPAAKRQRTEGPKRFLQLLVDGSGGKKFHHVRMLLR